MPSRANSLLRRLFQFRLRTLMLAILLLGCGMGWYVRRVELQRQEVKAIRDAGGTVFYDYQIVAEKLDPLAASWVPDFLRKWLGDDYFHSVVWVEFASLPSRPRPISRNDQPEWLVRLVDLPRLERLSLDRVRDRDMEVIGTLTQLEWLLLARAQGVTDAGVARLKGMQKLKLILIDNPSLTDDSLKTLALLPHMQHLGITGGRTATAHFTPEGMECIGRMKQLRSLSLQSQSGQIVSDDLVELTGLVELEELSLEGLNISDQGFENLEQLRRLKVLVLRGSTHPDIAGLSHVIPGCKIVP